MKLWSNLDNIIYNFSCNKFVKGEQMKENNRKNTHVAKVRKINGIQKQMQEDLWEMKKVRQRAYSEWLEASWNLNF